MKFIKSALLPLGIGGVVTLAIQRWFDVDDWEFWAIFLPVAILFSILIEIYPDNNEGFK